MCEEELFYHPQTNSLYEVVKQLKYSAVVRLHSGGGGDYAVVTSPVIDDYSISWRLKFNCDSKQSAIETAKGIDLNMEIFKNQTDYLDTARDIDEAFAKNNDGYSFRSDNALEELLQEHSLDEISTVLAVYINRNDHDGRISITNKEWAKNYIAENSVNIDDYRPINNLQHNGLVNMFADDLRKTEQTPDFTQGKGGRK